MKVGVLDVGSNSVRLMLAEDGRTLLKECVVTRLSEGLDENGILKEAAVNRTLAAIVSLVEKAKRYDAEKIYAFATEAVRSAKNGGEFADCVGEKTGVSLIVLDGKTEAEIGLNGALCGKDGLVLDIGGASSELACRKDGKIIYEHSLSLGAVRITGLCGQDRGKAVALIGERINEYGIVPSSELTAIGGTATTLAAIDLEAEPYDPLRVDGHILTREKLQKFVDLLYALPVEERKGIKGLQPQRAEAIASGALLLLSIADYLSVRKITVSERDNLEGYLLRVTENE